MPSIAYNDRAAKAAKPIDGKRTPYSVEGHPNLQLVVSPAEPNPKRRWYVRYQVGHGRTARTRNEMPLGSTDTHSISQAWDEACEAIKLATKGIDPKVHREEQALAAQQAKGGDVRTLSVVFEEWLDNPARDEVLRPRTRDEYRSIFKRHIAKHLGAVAMAEITKPKITEALEQIRRATTGGNRNGRGLQATKVLKIIRPVCKFAARRGYIATDPTFGIELPVPTENPEGKQSRAPTDAELRIIWNEAHNHMAAGHARALKLALLLGRRISEIVLIERGELELEGRSPRWRVPANREGNKSRMDYIVPLPPLAVAILHEQIASVGASPFVFQARAIEYKPMSRHSPSQDFLELRRALGVAETVRFHDARSLVSDQMAMMRVPTEYRSHVLQHSGDMNAALANSAYSIYDREPEKRRALRLWALRLQEIVRGRKPRVLRW